MSCLISDRVVPDQIKFQVVSPNRDEDGSRTTPSNAEFEYDEETKTMKVPLSALQETRNERRTRLVTFSCNKCGEMMLMLPSMQLLTVMEFGTLVYRIIGHAHL